MDVEAQARAALATGLSAASVGGDDSWITADQPNAEQFWGELRQVQSMIGLTDSEVRYILLRADGMGSGDAMETALHDVSGLRALLEMDPATVRRVYRTRAARLEREPSALRLLAWLNTRGAELGIVDRSRWQWSLDASDNTLRGVIDEVQHRLEMSRQTGREVPSALAQAAIRAVHELNTTHGIGADGSDAQAGAVIIDGADRLED